MHGPERNKFAATCSVRAGPGELRARASRMTRRGERHQQSFQQTRVTPHRGRGGGGGGGRGGRGGRGRGSKGRASSDSRSSGRLMAAAATGRECSCAVRTGASIQRMMRRRGQWTAARREAADASDTGGERRYDDCCCSRHAAQCASMRQHPYHPRCVVGCVRCSVCMRPSRCCARRCARPACCLGRVGVAIPSAQRPTRLQLRMQTRPLPQSQCARGNAAPHAAEEERQAEDARQDARRRKGAKVAADAAAAEEDAEESSR